MQRCALAGLAAFTMVSLVVADHARGQGGTALPLPEPVGSCFVAENTQVGRDVRARLVLNLRETRIIAVYAPCEPRPPLAKSATYGGYAEIFVNLALVMILGKEHDTAAYVQDLCSALRGSKSRDDFETAWRDRLDGVVETARELVERARKNAKVNSIWTGDRAFLLTHTGACLSWELEVELSEEGPLVSSRVEAFGSAVKGRHLILVDHAEFTGRDQVEAHVARVREMVRELARLNK
jgi:hypothetical protein